MYPGHNRQARSARQGRIPSLHGFFFSASLPLSVEPEIGRPCRAILMDHQKVQNPDDKHLASNERRAGRQIKDLLLTQA
jgi:hypothetical protein